MTSTDSNNTGTIQQRWNDTLSKVKLVIHNQCHSIELVSPVYAGYSTTCHLPPDQRISVGSTMQAEFDVALFWIWSIGVLIYRLQRKNTDQPNDNIASSEEESTFIQLAIIWKINNSKEFRMVSRLIEHDERHIWNRDELMKLAKLYKLFNLRHGPIEDTYLMHNHTTLMTSLNVTREEKCYKLEVTVSETSIKDDTQRLRYIGLNRQVSMMMLITMFKY
jgi:hypothetical protein